MAEKYMFFNSTAADRRRHTAGDMAEYWSSFLSTGLISWDENPLLRVVADGETNTLTIEPGRALVKGHLYINTDDMKKSVSLPESKGSRIDRVVLRMDNQRGVDDSRYIKIYIKEGAEEEPPELERIFAEGEVVIYELSLAQVRIREGVTYITQDDVTDERMDEELCGIASSLVSVPTGEFTKEWLEFKEMYLSWFNSLEDVSSYLLKKDYEKRDREITKELSYTNLKVNARDRIISGNTFGIDGAASFGLDFESTLPVEFNKITGHEIKVLRSGFNASVLLNQYIMIGDMDKVEVYKVVSVTGDVLTLNVEVDNSYNFIYLTSYNQTKEGLLADVDGTFMDVVMDDLPQNKEFDGDWLFKIEGSLFSFKTNGVVNEIKGDGYTDDSFTMHSGDIQFVMPFKNFVLYSGAGSKIVIYDVLNRKVVKEKQGYIFPQRGFMDHPKEFFLDSDNAIYYAEGGGRLGKVTITDDFDIDFHTVFDVSDYVTNSSGYVSRPIGKRGDELLIWSSYSTNSIPNSKFHLFSYNTLTNKVKFVSENVTKPSGMDYQQVARHVCAYSNDKIFIVTNNGNSALRLSYYDVTDEAGSLAPLGSPTEITTLSSTNNFQDTNYFIKPVNEEHLVFVLVKYRSGFQRLEYIDIDSVSLEFNRTIYDGINPKLQFPITKHLLSDRGLPTNKATYERFKSDDITGRYTLLSGRKYNLLTFNLDLSDCDEFVAFVNSIDEFEIVTAKLNDLDLTTEIIDGEGQIFGRYPIEGDANTVNIAIRPLIDMPIKQLIGGYSK